MSFVIRQNTISPGLRTVARRVRNKRPILQVMGVALQSWTVDSFVNSSKRIQPWPAKKDGTPSNLTKTTTLRRSIRQVELTNDHVDIGTDRPYAAVHQLGSKGEGGTSARPYFPFHASGRIHAPAARVIQRAAQKKLDSLLGNL